MTRHRILATSLTLAAVAAVMTIALAPSAAPRAAAAPEASVKRPNIVFILTDDLSWNLLSQRWAPHIMALERQGETFRNYYVADSLCCPSRTTLFTGLYPHDSKVITNVGPDGGYQRFQAENLAPRTWAVALHAAGYRTSMIGKYLNGYGDPQMTPQTAPIPPGWSDWHVSNSSGYAEFNYELNDNGKIDSYGGPTAGGGPSGAPDAYGVDVDGAWAQKFIEQSGSKPFAVEIATFAPHEPFVPAPRNANDFPGLTEPRDPSFNTPNIDPPGWLARKKPLTPATIASLDADYRLRVQDVEAVDLTLSHVEQTLANRHELSSTYIVFSSDNGYHIGQHQLTRGKQTAFDTDIHVPLIIAGPGVPKGRSIGQVAQNTDLCPTFEALAHTRPTTSADGSSLLPLLRPAARSPRWPTVALVEHEHVDKNSAGPDFDGGVAGGDPTTYQAIRLVDAHVPGFAHPLDAVYVEYQDAEHELEFYDIAKDPFERNNIAGALTAAQRAALHRILIGLHACHGQAACSRAGQPR